MKNGVFGAGVWKREGVSALSQLVKSDLKFFRGGAVIDETEVALKIRQGALFFPKFFQQKSSMGQGLKMATVN